MSRGLRRCCYRACSGSTHRASRASARSGNLARSDALRSAPRMFIGDAAARRPISWNGPSPAREVAEIHRRDRAEIHRRDTAEMCWPRPRRRPSRRFIPAVHLGGSSRRYISAVYPTEAEGEHAERVTFGGPKRLERRARVDPLRGIRRDQAEIVAHHRRDRALTRSIRRVEKSPMKSSEGGTCAGVSRIRSVCEPPARASASAISAPVSTCQMRKLPYKEGPNRRRRFRWPRVTSLDFKTFDSATC